MPGPELVIPIRLDPAKAVSGLQKVSTAGKQAGDDVAGGMKGAQSATQNLGSEMSNLARAQVVLSALKDVAQGIGESFKKTAEEVMQSAKAFQQLREAMQSIAALKSVTNTNEFTLEEIQKAEGANVKPEEWKEAKGALLARASRYIGDTPESKITSDEADKAQKKLAEFAKQRGIHQKDMAGFTGGILQFQKGKTNAEDLVSRVGKNYAALEAASTEPQELMNKLTELMAQGFSPEEGSAIISMMPEIAAKAASKAIW